MTDIPWLPGQTHELYVLLVKSVIGRNYADGDEIVHEMGTNQPAREHEPTNFCPNSAVLLLSPPGDAFSFRRSGQECFSWSVLIGCVPAEHEVINSGDSQTPTFPGGTKKSSIIFEGILWTAFTWNQILST